MATCAFKESTIFNPSMSSLAIVSSSSSVANLFELVLADTARSSDKCGAIDSGASCLKIFRTSFRLCLINQPSYAYMMMSLLTPRGRTREIA